jgi:hypothetical protein
MASMRFLFLIFFIEEKEASISTAELIKSLYIGLKFDWRVALLVSLPWLLLVPISRRFSKISSIKKWKYFYSIFFCFLTLFYILDFGYFQYLKTHVNATVFEFIDEIFRSCFCIFL